MLELNMRDSTDASLIQMAPNYGLVYIAFSTAIFYRLSARIIPEYIDFFVIEKNKKWLFKNICNSLIHSTISSIWIGFCLWNYPMHRNDLINVYSNQAHLLICFSVGYFIFDLMDMWFNDFENSFVLLIHHLVVIGVFGVALYTRYYLGYAMAGLLVEVNSIFLHVRTLMRLTNKCHTTSYLCICILNFVTFIVFRIYLLAYLTYWLISHRSILSQNLFVAILPCLVCINGMSWLLFTKTTVEDFSNPIHYIIQLVKCNNNLVNSRTVSPSKSINNGTISSQNRTVSQNRSINSGTISSVNRTVSQTRSINNGIISHQIRIVSQNGLSQNHSQISSIGIDSNVPRSQTEFSELASSKGLVGSESHENTCMSNNLNFERPLTMTFPKEQNECTEKIKSS